LISVIIFWPGDDFGQNIRVEFVGFCFDVLLLGLIYAIFKRRNKRDQDIKRWQEEIDDYRGWDEKEATFRIVGNVKRLNREKISAIRLQFCYLREAKLTKTNLKGAILFNADLENARLGEADLSNADLRFANLKRSYLVGAIFEGADLSNANFDGAQWGRYLFPDSTGYKFIIGNAPMYSFIDGAIVDSTEWIENLIDGDLYSDDSLLNIYHISTWTKLFDKIEFTELNEQVFANSSQSQYSCQK